MVYTDNQLNWMHKHLGRSFCRVTDGVMTNVHTGEVIPLGLTIYQKVWSDGQYELGEMTCGNAMPTGFNEETLESNPKIENPTKADKDKYQCRVGRHAPLCGMYSPKKCAVYSIDRIGKYQVQIDLEKLIAISGVN